jgi:hypothetical protein
MKKSKPDYDVHARRVCAPHGFTTAHVSNLEFFERARLFTRVMTSLNRVTILTVNEKGEFFLSSIPAVIK